MAIHIRSLEEILADHLSTECEMRELLSIIYINIINPTQNS